MFLVQKQLHRDTLKIRKPVTTHSSLNALNIFSSRFVMNARFDYTKATANYYCFLLFK